MKIGTLLILEINEPDSKMTRKYRSKVIEKNEHYLFIDYPIDQQTKKTAFLPKNTHFVVTYVDENYAVYSFHSEIAEKVKLPIPALAIRIPLKDKVKRIQRREYVRIGTAVDVSIHSTDTSFSPFTTVTADISGGGLSIILPNDARLKKGDTADIWLVLPMQSGEYVYVSAQTEVVRVVASDNKISTASLKFVSITTQKQQRIIRFCFEKQREARKKELL